MNRILFLYIFILLVTVNRGFAQDTLTVRVTDGRTGLTLPGITLRLEGRKGGAVTDPSGVSQFTGLQAGSYVLNLTGVGYEPLSQPVAVPYSDTLRLQLTPSSEELEEVVITSTRSTRSIDDEPTRVEVISGEELDEKTNMNSANISILLRETPGIQVQQTSATSANVTFRIQGLDGRYTQLLQNGLPLYAGFSSGLSLLQIPPLDLRQVEIIKGSQSTLYGGGAIAGIVNLVTKEPGQERESLLLVNGTSAGGLDLNSFFSGRGKRLGYTLYLARNTQRSYDPNSDGFSDIPFSRRVTVNPRLFVYLSDRTTADFGVNISIEDRTGGDLAAIRDGQPGYTEQNLSDRYTTQLNVRHRLNEATALYVKNSVTFFDRTLKTPDYRFGGRQRSSFSEAGISRYGTEAEWIGGLNLWTDSFREAAGLDPRRDYTLNTVGAFVQNVFKPSPPWTLETGLRLDHQPTYGTFLLPRVSLLFKASDRLTSRLGGGLGYKAPTIFTEEAEQRLYRAVLPIDPRTVRAETSQGLNWDVNYRTSLGGDWSLNLNHLFFLTRIQNPLVLEMDPSERNAFRNAAGHLDSRGFETNLTIRYADFRLYGFYTFIDTKRHYEGQNRPLALTARHRVGSVLMYEVEHKWRIGYEAYYTGRQELESRRTTRPYWIMGFMLERSWEQLSLFINFENFTDTRQSRWEAMVSGPRQKPVFTREIYAPTDGRIINGGIKLRF